MLNSLDNLSWNNIIQHLEKGEGKSKGWIHSKLYSPGPSFYYTNDPKTSKVWFTAPETTSLLGIHPAEFSIQDYYKKIHPDDLSFFIKCENEVSEFLKDHVNTEITKYKFSFCYRCQVAESNHKMVLHQAIAISKDGFGRVTKMLNIVSEVGHLNLYNNYQLMVMEIDSKNSLTNPDIISRKSDEDKLKRPFTKREIQIISLFAKGMTAEEIGHKLGISTGTIRTHRQNVLFKSDCKNMTELVANAIRKGII